MIRSALNYSATDFNSYMQEVLDLSFAHTEAQKVIARYGTKPNLPPSVVDEEDELYAAEEDHRLDTLKRTGDGLAKRLRMLESNLPLEIKSTRTVACLVALVRETVSKTQ